MTVWREQPPGGSMAPVNGGGSSEIVLTRNDNAGENDLEKLTIRAVTGRSSLSGSSTRAGIADLTDDVTWVERM